MGGICTEYSRLFTCIIERHQRFGRNFSGTIVIRLHLVCALKYANCHDDYFVSCTTSNAQFFFLFFFFWLKVLNLKMHTLYCILFFLLKSKTLTNAFDDNLNFVKSNYFHLMRISFLQLISCNKKNGNDVAVVNRKCNKSFSIGGRVSTPFHAQHHHQPTETNIWKIFLVTHLYTHSLNHTISAVRGTWQVFLMEFSSII